MNHFINNIKINHLLHLQDFNIPISDKENPHLLITGKNGSGKTILLCAVAEFLDKIKNDGSLYYKEYRSWAQNYLDSLNTTTDAAQKLRAKTQYEQFEKRVQDLFGQVEIEFDDVATMINAYQQNQFILAFYQADRKILMKEPLNPTKPTISSSFDIRTSATDQFLYFLSDLKIQEALARNENMIEDADKIKHWFVGFEEILKQIYQDEQLLLVFDYRDYSFWIESEGKRFKFTQTSDGFAAVLDIVADLILKMQSKDRLTHVYDMEGVVLIDEIETHLHLELQKIIMPLLTKIFPNIQFIVTTHSPFVLNSLDNAIAFDLEHRKVIDELTDYSYASLAEGYFGVSSESSYMQMQFEKLVAYLKQEEYSDVDKLAVRSLIEDFDKVSDLASPAFVGKYLSLKTHYSEKLNQILS